MIFGISADHFWENLILHNILLYLCSPILKIKVPFLFLDIQLQCILNLPPHLQYILHSFNVINLNYLICKYELLQAEINNVMPLTCGPVSSADKVLTMCVLPIATVVPQSYPVLMTVVPVWGWETHYVEDEGHREGHTHTHNCAQGCHCRNQCVL